MNCSNLRCWLDEGSPGASEGAAREHAARCASCAALLRAHLEIERLLTPEPAGGFSDHAGAHPRRPGALPDRARFVDQVMQRVASAQPQSAPVELWPAMTPLPWWVEAAADPGVVLACVFAALLLWRVDWLEHLGRLAGERWSALAWPALAQAREAMGMDRPAIMLAFTLLALLALGWISIHLYHWTERLARRSAGT